MLELAPPPVGRASGVVRAAGPCLVGAVRWSAAARLTGPQVVGHRRVDRARIRRAAVLAIGKHTPALPAALLGWDLGERAPPGAQLNVWIPDRHAPTWQCHAAPRLPIGPQNVDRLMPHACTISSRLRCVGGYSPAHHARTACVDTPTMSASARLSMPARVQKWTIRSAWVTGSIQSTTLLYGQVLLGPRAC